MCGTEGNFMQYWVGRASKCFHNHVSLWVQLKFPGDSVNDTYLSQISHWEFMNSPYNIHEVAFRPWMLLPTRYVTAVDLIRGPFALSISNHWRKVGILIGKKLKINCLIECNGILLTWLHHSHHQESPYRKVHSDFTLPDVAVLSSRASDIAVRYTGD